MPTISIRITGLGTPAQVGLNLVTNNPDFVDDVNPGMGGGLKLESIDKELLAANTNFSSLSEEQAEQLVGATMSRLSSEGLPANTAFNPDEKPTEYGKLMISVFPRPTICEFTTLGQEESNKAAAGGAAGGAAVGGGGKRRKSRRKSKRRKSSRRKSKRRKSKRRKSSRRRRRRRR